MDENPYKSPMTRGEVSSGSALKRGLRVIATLVIALRGAPFCAAALVVGGLGVMELHAVMIAVALGSAGIATLCFIAANRISRIDWAFQGPLLGSYGTTSAFPGDDCDRAGGHQDERRRLRYGRREKCIGNAFTLRTKRPGNLAEIVDVSGLKNARSRGH